MEPSVYVNTFSSQFHQSHKYLSQSPPTNEFTSASVDRIISRIFQRLEPDSDTPRQVAVVVAKSEPNIWAPWTDVTRARTAYGRLGLPKLKKELSSTHTFTVCQALCTLSDLLHDPEMACEAIAANFQARFVRLLQSLNPFIQQRALMCITTMANQPYGHVRITRNEYLMKNIRECLLNESYVIKNQAIKAICALLSHPVVYEFFIEHDFIRFIIKCLLAYKEGSNQEFYDCDYMVMLLKGITNLLQYSDSAKIQAMAYDVFLLIDLLAHSKYKVRNNTAKVFTEIFKHKIGKLASSKWPFVEYMTAGFETEKGKRNLGLLSSLRFATIEAENRKTALFHGLIDRLVEIVNHTQDTDILLNAVQTLTNIAEHPEGRQILREIGANLIFSFDSKQEQLKQNVIELFNIIQKPL